MIFAVVLCLVTGANVQFTGFIKNNIDMKRSLLYSGLMLALLGVFASCNKDSKSDENWKDIPSNQFTAESGKAEISVNSIPVSIGNVKLTASSATEGVLQMNNVIPCASSVAVNVNLKNAGDSKWTFSGEGNIYNMTVMSLFSADKTPIYTVSVEGEIDGNEKISVKAATKVVAKGGMEGDWNLLREAAPDKDGVPVVTPLQITWTASGDYAVSAAMMGKMLSIFGSVQLADQLDRLSFTEDGNVTARYWESDEDSGNSGIPDMKEFDGIIKSLVGPDGKYHFVPTTHTEWIDLPPANLAFWYANGGNLFVLPNLSVLSEMEGAQADAFVTRAADLSGLSELLEELQKLGVDPKEILPVIKNFMANGLVMKYVVTDNSLQLFMDKELCDPIVKPLLPLLDQLDKKLEDMAKNPDITEEQKAELQKLQTLMGVFGLTKPSDLKAVWANTTEFAIAMNFVR